MEWQHWIDQLARQGLPLLSIAQLVSLASGVYAWASAPSHRLDCNPLHLVELAPSHGKPRMHVAFAPEAALPDAVEPEDRLPDAIASYAVPRRSEFDRLE